MSEPALNLTSLIQGPGDATVTYVKDVSHVVIRLKSFMWPLGLVKCFMCFLGTEKRSEEK